MAYQKLGFKNGNVLTAEQLIHMEDGIIDAEKKAASGTGTGLPSGGEPYMQLVTDGEGKAGWEERKGGYEKTVFAIELSKTAVEFTDGRSAYSAWGVGTSGDLKRVIFDGNVYTVKNNSISTNSGNEGYIGNPSLFDSSMQNTGEPFCLAFKNYQNYGIWYTNAGDGEHTIEVLYATTVYVPFRADYIPFVSPFSTVYLLTALEIPNGQTSVELEYPIVACNNYTITWGGTSYNRQSQVIEHGGLLLGNKHLYSESEIDTGEPFAIVVPSEDKKAATFYSDSDETVKVYMHTNEYRIMEEFLPNTTFQSHGDLADANLDKVTALGYYNLTTSYTYTNTPDSLTNGALLVFSSGASRVQLFMGKAAGSGLYTRRYIGGAWKDWVAYATKDEAQTVSYFYGDDDGVLYKDEARTIGTTIDDFKDVLNGYHVLGNVYNKFTDGLISSGTGFQVSYTANDVKHGYSSSDYTSSGK